MLRRILLVTDLLTLLGLSIVLAAVAYFGLTYPVAFQKAMALTSTPLQDPDWESGGALDVRRFVNSIPFRGSERVNLVRPSQLFEACIKQGRGNCANKSRALSWYLVGNDIPLQRVDLLPIDGFLEGKGHTIVRTRYTLDGEVRVGIVDLLEGALPTLRDVPIDLPEFRGAPPFACGLLKLSPRVDDASDYYGSYLETVVIGAVEGEQIARYLQYLERWHVDVGLPTYERVVFAAWAIVIGIFPETHVTPEQYDMLYRTAPWIFRTAYTLTWTVRVLLVLLPLAFVLHAWNWLSRRRTASAAKDRPASTPAAA